MSTLTDFIFQFQQRISNRYTNKTLPLSIKKEDHANSFNELSDALLLLINPIDDNKKIVFDTQTLVTLDWQAGLAPNSASTFAELFGNNPDIATYIDNGDDSFSKLAEDAQTWVRDSDHNLLLQVRINLGAFPQSGEIIIN